MEPHLLQTAAQASYIQEQIRLRSYIPMRHSWLLMKMSRMLQHILQEHLAYREHRLSIKIAVLLQDLRIHLQDFVRLPLNMLLRRRLTLRQTEHTASTSQEQSTPTRILLQKVQIRALRSTLIQRHLIQ